jgi:hypothetical protein
MLIAGAVCPHPPLLIPAALGAAATEPPAELRKVAAAATAAVAGLLAAGPDLIAVVGGGETGQEYGPQAAGGLHGYGVDVTVGAGERVLPLPLTVGRWLLEQAGLASLRPGADASASPEVLFQAVDRHAPPSVCRKLGMIVAGRAARVAVLAMGDASARRAREAPELPDPEAEDYDDDVAEALAAADTRWLCRLDPAFDSKLVVAGRAAWQVLAGAAEGRRLDGRLLCMTSPYGVTYLVASWGQQPQDG